METALCPTSSTIDIAFCFDKNYYRQAVIAIASLLLTAKNNGSKITYNLHLLVNKDVDNKIQKEIKNILCKQYRYVNFSFKVIDDSFDDAYECRGITKACYYRLLLHRILPHLDRVIYSDVDVIFFSDLTELSDFPIEDYYYAANKDVIYSCSSGRARVTSQYEYWNNELKDIGKNYRNSGFLLLNLNKLREADIDAKIIELSKRDFNFQDQDILNMLFIREQEKIGTLSPKFATLAGARKQGLYTIAFNEGVISKQELEEVSNNPAVLHYAGKKPWDIANKAEGNIWWDFIKDNNIYYYHFQKKMINILAEPSSNSLVKKLLHIKKIKTATSNKYYIGGFQVWHKKITSNSNSRQHALTRILESILSVKNSATGRHKVITLLSFIRIKVRRKDRIREQLSVLQRQILDLSTDYKSLKGKQDKLYSELFELYLKDNAQKATSTPVKPETITGHGVLAIPVHNEKYLFPHLRLTDIQYMSGGGV